MCFKTIKSDRIKVLKLKDINNKISIIKKGKKNRNSDFDVEKNILLLLENYDLTPKFIDMKIKDENYILNEEYIDGDDLSRITIESIDLKIGRKFLIKSLIDNLHFLHLHNVIHLDYTFDNIILENENYSLKIIDFGCSKIINSSDMSPLCLFNEYFSKYLFYAPEFLREDIEYDGRKYDVFCLGIMIFYYLTGKCFYMGINENNFQKKLDDLEYWGFSDYVRNIHPDVNLSDIEIDFLSLCLNPNNSERSLTDELMFHSFYNSLFN